MLADVEDTSSSGPESMLLEIGEDEEEEHERFSHVCDELRANNPFLQDFDLSTFNFPFTESDAESLGSALTGNTHLRKLYLVFAHVNAVHYASFAALTEFVRRSRSLQRFELVDSGTGGRQTRSPIVDAFLVAASESQSIGSVQIFGAYYGFRSMVRLVRYSTSLQSLHHNYSDCVDDLNNDIVTREFVEAFAVNRELKVLLTGRMDSRITVPLLHQLAFHPSLHTLGPSIDDEASAMALYAYLVSAPPQMTRLVFGFIRFCEEYLEPVVSGLRQCQGLDSVSIRDCEWECVTPGDSDGTRPTSAYGASQQALVRSMQQRFLTAVTSNIAIRDVEFGLDSGIGLNFDTDMIRRFLQLRNRCIQVLGSQDEMQVPRSLVPRLIARCLNYPEPAVGLSSVFVLFQQKPCLWRPVQVNG